jgi:NADH-quinone oxidoreductase subunit N
MALALLILIFSVAGIPPAAGFWGKFVVFEAGLRADLLWLVIVGVVSSVVSLGYYLRLVWAMWMKEPAGALERTEWGAGVAVAASALLAFPVLFIGIGTLVAATSAAAG